jgi:hypothetical protein
MGTENSSNTRSTLRTPSIHRQHGSADGRDVTEEDESSTIKSSTSDDSSLLDLQSCSSNFEDEDVNRFMLDTELKGIQRLERKLELRRQRLRKLCAGRRSSYVQLLQANEQAASEITLTLYRERRPVQHTKTISKNKNKLESSSPKDASRIFSPESIEPHSTNTARNQQNPSMTRRIWWMTLFECHLTLPAFFTVLIILLGHATFYNALEVSLKCLFYTFFHGYMTLEQFFLAQIAIGLLLLRMNGNAFYWLNSNDYNLVRLELQNRLTLGSMDAGFLKRIKGTVWSSALNMFGYYLACIGVYHFYYVGQLATMRPFEAWYVKIFLEAGGTFDPLTGQEIKPPCQDIVDVVLSSNDSILWQWLMRYFCSDTTAEWRLIVLLYHGFWLAVTTLVAARLGHGLLTLCD